MKALKKMVVITVVALGLGGAVVMPSSGASGGVGPQAVRSNWHCC